MEIFEMCTNRKAMPRNRSSLRGPGAGLAVCWRSWAELEGLPLEEAGAPKPWSGRGEL